MSHTARSLKDLQRKKPKRSPYDRVLIVCEGKKTEPNYFQALVDDLELNTANVDVDRDADSSPRSIISHAKKRYKDDLRENGKQDCFDRVYCVFDRDEHATFTEAINTINTASPSGVFFAITSTPCFEYWLLLHFENSTRPYTRTGNRSPCDNCLHELKMHIPDYLKGDKTIYQQLKQRVDVAFRNAEQVNAAARASGFNNPSTSIPDLVLYLKNLKAR